VTLSIGIRGGGLAGMAVADALTQRVPNCSVHIFDKRERLPHPERTFCFFGGSAIKEFNLPIAKEWPKVLFAGANFKRICDSSQRPYSIVHGEEYFSKTLSVLEARGVKFSWQELKVEISSNTITTNNSNYRFDIVIDTAFDVSEAKPLLWQSFAGHWITTASDRFEPGVATLMEVKPSSHRQSINFIYILPMSARAALVEHTSFCAEPMAPKWHLDLSERWLEEKGIADWQISRTENGLIPMGLAVSNRIPGVISIGSSAGSIRASTGYAFLKILRQSQEIASYVAQTKTGSGLESGNFVPSEYPIWMKLSDQIFLRALRNMPELGADIISNLLERAPEKALIRFLAGEADILSALRVMLAAPKTAMLRALSYA